MSIVTGPPVSGPEAGPPPVQRRGRGPTVDAGTRSRVLLQTGAVVAVLAVWWAVHATGVLSEAVLPSPVAVAGALAHEIVTAVFWAAVGATVAAALAGLAVALVVGVVLGLLTGTYRSAERSGRVLMDVGRAFPIFAILPVLILVIGATPTMKAVCVFIACLFPIWLQAQYGASSLDVTVQDTARAYRIPGLLNFRRVVLPAALPSIMTGLRLGATTSVLVCVGVEILTSVNGIGARIVDRQLGGASAGAFAYIFAAGCIGFTITKLSEVAEERVLRWRPPTESD